MEYLLLIYAEESAGPDHWPEEERAPFYEGYGALNRELEDKGAFVAARRLETVDTATTVRVRDDETMLTDGPFAETKECLAGFYLVEAENLDQALDWASRIPGARIGSIEVRPIRRY